MTVFGCGNYTLVFLTHFYGEKIILLCCKLFYICNKREDYTKLQSFAGQMFTIPYALIGMPLLMVFLGKLDCFFYATETYFTHFLEEARFPNSSPIAFAKGEALGNRASSRKCVKYVSVA